MNSLQLAFTELWAMLISFIPLLVAALAVIFIGLFVAGILKQVTRSIFTTLRVDHALEKAGVGAAVERTGYKLNTGLFMGTLVKWFVVLVFLIVALDILRLTEVTTFIREVVIGYFPRVIVAVLIMIIAVIVAGVARSTATAAARTAELKQPEFLGKLAYGAVVAFAVLAILNQLQIAQELVQMLFAGMVFAISLAFGLAFGFGGRDTATRYLDSITRR